MSFPRKLVLPSSQVVAALAACFALAGTSGCEPQSAGGETESVTSAASASTNKVDILFMVDNSSSMTSMQQKMLAQIPVFIQSLQALPSGLPDLHLAVVSSDMGAQSDQGSAIGCDAFGENGVFQNQPRGTCTTTGLLPGATFISDNAAGTTKNFTLADPAGLSTVFQCIGLLGSSGCGFEHQLTSVARALGADGQPAPSANQGFLRDDAELAIVFLTNEDDCSATPNTTLYSLNGGPQSLSNSLGPIANYRCNQFGHLCTDPTSALPNAFNPPPLNPPADYAGPASAPTLTLTNCESNDTGTGLLIPVIQIVAGIKALKAQPSYDIVVGAIIAPATPYTVEWIPQNITPSEAWPAIEHSCGPTSDGSFGDPGVRIAQFVQAFGDNGVTTSICDNSYEPAFQIIASKIAAHLPAAISDAGRPASGTGGLTGRDGGGTGGYSGFTGSSFGGTTGSSFAGTSGTGSGGTHGTGTAGTTGTGTGTAGTTGTGTGTAGTTGTGTAGATGTGNGGTPGTGAAGSSGATGGGAAGGRGGAGGHAGASPVGNGGGAGTTLGTGSGCDCQTGGGSAGASSFTLLIGLLFARRHRRAALTGAR
jgi:hypothetical protein